MKQYVLKWCREDFGYYAGYLDTYGHQWTNLLNSLPRKIFTDKDEAKKLAAYWDPVKVLRLRRPTVGYVIKADISGLKYGVSYFCRFMNPARSVAVWTDDWSGEKRKVFATKAEAKEALTAWGKDVPDWMTIVRLVARKRGNGDS